MPDPQPRKVFKVGGEVTAPKILTRVEVSTPESMKNRRYQLGVLIISAVIDETGTPIDVKAMNHQTNPFTSLHLDAIRQWTFEPGTYRGNPVPVEFIFTVHHFPVEEAP